MRTAGLSLVVSPGLVGCHVVVVSRFSPSTLYFRASDWEWELNWGVAYPWSIIFDIFLVTQVDCRRRTIVSQDVGVGSAPSGSLCRLVVGCQCPSPSPSPRGPKFVRGPSPRGPKSVRGPRSKSVRGPSRGPSPRSKFEVRGPSSSSRSEVQVQSSQGPSPCLSPSPVQVQVSVCVPCWSVGQLVVGLSESLRHAAPGTCSSKILFIKNSEK